MGNLELEYRTKEPELDTVLKSLADSSENFMKLIKENPGYASLWQFAQEKLPTVNAALHTINHFTDADSRKNMYENHLSQSMNQPLPVHQPPWYDPTQSSHAAPYHTALPQWNPDVQGSQYVLEALPQQYAIEAPPPQPNVERLQNALRMLQNSQATSKGVVEGSTWRHIY
jgi:hypothetical protein